MASGRNSRPVQTPTVCDLYMRVALHSFSPSSLVPLHVEHLVTAAHRVSLCIHFDPLSS